MPHRLRLLRAPLAALALHLLGCQPVGTPDAKPTERAEVAPDRAAAPAPAPVADAQDPAPQAPPATVAMTGEGSVVTLVDAGAEPREPLRLKLAAGQEQAMIMTMRMSMAMQVGANKLPKTDVPPMQMVMKLRVQEITAEGDIRSAFSLDKIDVLPEPGVPAEVVTQLEAMLGTMSKLSGTSTLTPRGIVKAAEFNIPDDVNPQIRQTMDSMRQQINQLSVPFPEEPLGAGARWTVTQHLEQQGMKLQQIATWELKGREGDVVKLASTIVQTAAPQPIVAPGMAPGAEVTLDRLNSNGAGTTEVDLARVAPVQGTMTLTSSLAMTTTAQGMKMPLTMDMVLGLEIRSE